jgi:hypothetical protein
MNGNKICFIICTNNEIWYEECKLYIQTLYVPKDYLIEVIPVIDAKSMTAGYNTAMGLSDAKYKVYLHHDVFILNKNFIQETLSIFNRNKEIGMLGMVGSWDIKKQYIDALEWECGRIAVGTGSEMVDVTYGKMANDLEYVDCVDGLLIMTQYDIFWREDLFQSWHFYDRSQCMEFKRAGYCVVVPKQDRPWCLHDSGVSSLLCWNDGLDIFYKEYGEFFYDKLSMEKGRSAKHEGLQNNIKNISQAIIQRIDSGNIQAAREAYDKLRPYEEVFDKTLALMWILFEIYDSGKVRLFWCPDDTFDIMEMKYHLLKFTLRNVQYKMQLNEDKLSILEISSEKEKEIVMKYNINLEIY